MSAKADLKKQVRLDQDIYDELGEIQDRCSWPVTLGVLANFGLRHGMNSVRRTFNRKNKTAATSKKVGSS